MDIVTEDLEVHLLLKIDLVLGHCHGTESKTVSFHFLEQRPALIMVLRIIVRIAIFVAVGTAIYLFVQTFRQYSVAQIYDALLTIPLNTLILSLMFAGASYATLSLFDALAVRYVGKPIGSLGPLMQPNANVMSENTASIPH